MEEQNEKYLALLDLDDGQDAFELPVFAKSIDEAEQLVYENFEKHGVRPLRLRPEVHHAVSTCSTGEKA